MAPNVTWTLNTKTGKWKQEARQQKPTNKGDKNQNWWDTKEGDWACIHCDTMASPTYQGNYARDKHCRECLTCKGIRHHMTMPVRTWRLNNGTLKTREEMLADRANNSNKNNTTYDDPNKCKSTKWEIC